MSNEEQIEELKKIIAEEKEKKLEATRAWRRKIGIDKVRELRRGYNKKYVQNMTPERREEFRKKETARTVDWARRSRLKKATRPKPPACEVCSRVCDTVFDHSHTSNEFRGWLCDNCNWCLGLVEDNPLILEQLAVYLRTHDKGEPK